MRRVRNRKKLGEKARVVGVERVPVIVLVFLGMHEGVPTDQPGADSVRNDLGEKYPELSLVLPRKIGRRAEVSLQ